MSGSACVIQSREDAWRATFLDEVAYDLVIEVLDRRPLDLFSDILFLFRLESELDKNLLKLLVYVVDTELLERVVLQCEVTPVSE